MTKPIDLTGRVVIVSGGGMGAGPAITLALLAAGASVAITGASSDEALETVVERARHQEDAGRILAIRADVTIEAACSAVVHEVRARFGAVNGLVNNAGIGLATEVMGRIDTGPGAFWETPAGVWRRLLDINLTAPFLMAQAVVPAMIDAGGGAIVNVAAGAGMRGGYGPYAATKSALEALSTTWSLALRDHGVAVNVLVPDGPVDQAGTPAVWLMSPAGRAVTGERISTSHWAGRAGGRVRRGRPSGRPRAPRPLR